MIISVVLELCGRISFRDIFVSVWRQFALSGKLPSRCHKKTASTMFVTCPYFTAPQSAGGALFKAALISGDTAALKGYHKRLILFPLLMVFIQVGLEERHNTQAHPRQERR